MENYKSNSGTFSSGLLAANKSIFLIIHGILSNGFITASNQARIHLCKTKSLALALSVRTVCLVQLRPDN